MNGGKSIGIHEKDSSPVGSYDDGNEEDLVGFSHLFVFNDNGLSRRRLQERELDTAPRSKATHNKAPNSRLSAVGRGLMP